MKHPSKLVNVGDQVEAVVLNVNPTERRISLGLKQLESNPWESFAREIFCGRYRGRQGAQPHRLRAFIEIEADRRLVHVSNLSGQAREASPSEVFEVRATR